MSSQPFSLARVGLASEMTSKWLSFVFKFAISIGLIVVLLYQVDLSDVPQRLASVRIWPISVAFLLVLLQFAFGAFRWRAALVAINAPLPYWLLFRLFFVGAFFSQALPSSVGGDAVRIWASWRAGLGPGPSFTGVMLERVATMVALVFVVALALPIFISRVDADSAEWWPWAVGLLALGCAGGIGLLMILDRIPEKLRRWGAIHALVQVAADTRSLFLSPRHSGRVLGWSVLGHVNIAIAVYALAVGLDIPVDMLDCVALVPPVLLVTALPISIAGWGVREGAMVAAFSSIGVEPGSAIVLSILFGLVIAVSSLPGGLFWLASSERRSKGKIVELDSDVVGRSGTVR